MNEEIKGTCTEMCPEDEIILREKECLLHTFEILPGTGNHKVPKPDRCRVVKVYSRSAAGQSMQSPKNLRTPDTLLKTIDYLLTDVISKESPPFHIVCDFITDRLHAVRQDMVIQRLSTAYSISILQPIVRFYAYTAYRLCDAPISRFDPSMNNKNLQECLKRLLVLYDECDQFSLESFSITNTNINIDEYEILYADCRVHMESLYMLFNLGDVSATNRVLFLPKRYRARIVNVALKISLHMIRGNYVGMCRMFNSLPTILAGVASLHLPMIRRTALRVMTEAYSSKSLVFPAHDLKTLLLYSKLDDLWSDCKHYGINYDEINNAVHFQKGQFNNSVKTNRARRETLVDDKLCGRSVTDLVLYGDIL